MPSKIHALAGCLLIIGTAAAHQTHTKHKSEYHTSAYTVRSGDNDWKIAHRLGLTVAQLHKLNPHEDWTDLKIGSKVKTAADSEPAKKGKVHTASQPKRVAEPRKRVVSRFMTTYRRRFAGFEKSQIVASNSPEVSRSVGGPTVGEILQNADRMRGTRYVWGGTSSRGVDCSGFTSRVFREVGIKLPRTSRSQSTIGVHVNRADLKAGDLLFFHTGGSYRINHVGLYIGNGKFIHASSGYGAVRVDSLDGHYGHELVTARRLPELRDSEIPVSESLTEEAATKPEEPGVAAQQDSVPVGGLEPWESVKSGPPAPELPLSKQASKDGKVH